MPKSVVCVDAGLVIRTLVPGPFTSEALALLRGWRRDKISLIAPALLAFEVTSVLRRYVHLGRISCAHGDKAFEAFQKLEIRLSHRQAIFPLAWDLAKRFDRPRAYDTTYLAYAQLNECDFWTTDTKLHNTVKEELDWVHWIGDCDPVARGG